MGVAFLCYKNLCARFVYSGEGIAQLKNICIFVKIVLSLWREIANVIS